MTVGRNTANWGRIALSPVAAVCGRSAKALAESRGDEVAGSIMMLLAIVAAALLHAQAQEAVPRAGDLSRDVVAGCFRHIDGGGIGWVKCAGGHIEPLGNL